MGIFGALKGVATGLAKAVGMDETIGKYANAEFLEASIAGCVAVSYSDGSFDANERTKLNQILTNYPAFSKKFTQSDISARVKHWCAQFDIDRDLGMNQVTALLQKFKSSDEQANALLTFYQIIGKGDGDFSQAEKEVVLLLAQSLGVDIEATLNKV